MDRLTELFCRINEFCQACEPEWNRPLLEEGRKKRCRRTALGRSELMTLAVLFHPLRFRHFLLQCRSLSATAPTAVSWSIRWTGPSPTAWRQTSRACPSSPRRLHAADVAYPELRFYIVIWRFLAIYIVQSMFSPAMSCIAEVRTMSCFCKHVRTGSGLLRTPKQ